MTVVKKMTEAAKVLANPDLKAYAEELRASDAIENLRDLAAKTRLQATRAGADGKKIPAVCGSMNCGDLVGLIDKSIVHGIDAALLKAVDSVEEIPVASADEMAKLLIFAERCRGEPNSVDSQKCAQKGISWVAKVNPDQICVIRARKNGTTKHFTYDCASDAEFNFLLKKVAAKRDAIKAEIQKQS